jgi:hypothetical protein
MRKLLIAFLLGSCYINAQVAPPTVQYYLEIPAPTNVPQMKSTMINGKTALSLEFKNKSITDLFKKFKISDFKLAFPGGKGQLLESAYIIECDPKLIEMIANRYPEVFGRFEVIEPMQPLYIPNDLGGTTGSPLLAQPELSFINAPQAWDISKGDRVFIGNSEGAYSLQEDLVGKITNMTTSSAWNAHGTQVATVSAGSTDNGVGIASSGYNSKIITNSGGYSALIPLANSGARAINMSWGSCNNAPLESQYGQAIMDQVWNMGVVLIAAAGNGVVSCSSLGPSVYHYPASLNHVISVTSVGHIYDAIDTTIGHGNRKDILEDFNVAIGTTVFKNTYNDKVDLSAPGHNVITAKSTSGQIIPNEYQVNWGTSFAAPMVMGVVGLIFSANSCLFPDEVESILKLTAVKNDLLSLNLPYQGKMGAGRLNAFDAVDMAKDMALPFGSVEVKNRIIDRWDFSLRTTPYEINLTNNLVTNNATLNFTARNDIDILSGDYNPTGTGFVDLKIKATNYICNSPITPANVTSKRSNILNKSSANELNKLYPNPNNGSFSISLQLDIKSDVNINIFDTQGKLVYKSISNKPNMDINLPELSKGLYIVKIFNDEIDETFKFIKN